MHEWAFVREGAFFSDKCKPSNESSRKLFKNDLQTAFQNNGNRLFSNGSVDNNNRLMFLCFRCRIRKNSKSTQRDSVLLSSKPCFSPNIQGMPFVRKKLAEKKARKNKHRPIIKPTRKTNVNSPKCDGEKCSVSITVHIDAKND